MSNSIALTLHLIAINIWIGGTFFIFVVMRHAATVLDLSDELTLWYNAFRRFFVWVWLATLLLLTSGLWMIYHAFGGVGNVPLYILIMVIIGMVMIINFLLLFFIPYRQFKHYYHAQDLIVCRQQLAIILIMGKINILLGLCILIVIGAGHFVSI